MKICSLSAVSSHGRKDFRSVKGLNSTMWEKMRVCLWFGAERAKIAMNLCAIIPRF